MLEWYQQLPEQIDPIIFSIGFFSVRWYSVMYFLGIFSIYLLLTYRLRKKEAPYSSSFLIDYLLYATLGGIIGARLGYAVFYDLGYFISNPLALISPVDSASGRWLGILGMSYHGGLIGILTVSFVFLKKRKINFWEFSDFVVPAVSIGYFFGRIGNFLNGELYGRVTNFPLGMYFPGDAELLLRHPSQLYEAAIEGLIIFFIFWLIRNRSSAKGKLLAFYLITFGLARFGVEFFRQPDNHIGFVAKYFTVGQLLSILMIATGAFLLYWIKIRSSDILETK